MKKKNHTSITYVAMGKGDSCKCHTMRKVQLHDCVATVSASFQTSYFIVDHSITGQKAFQIATKVRYCEKTVF